jgi:phosphate butyryltransferase
MDKLKIAALSPIEYINTAMPSTVDSAVLSKMSERGQIEAVIEGPLDFDAACSRIAADSKGIDSVVPGEADVLLFPDIESAYSFSHFLTFLFKIKMAGVLMETKAPVILNDRIYTPEMKLLNIALGVLRC